MKIAPVLRAFEHDGIETVLVHSGQHYDSAMSDVFFDELGIRQPDEHLGAGSGSHAAQTARIMTSFEPVLLRSAVDVVVVVGDVNSTVACGLVAAKCGVRVAHVEAGLRSRDWSMPEEINRVVTDRLSDLLFASSHDAAENLRSEGYREDQIHTVGNVMVDSLLDNLERARARPILDQVGVRAKEFGLVTLHRPSNVDDPEVFGRILDALRVIGAQIPLVFPVHPRTQAMLEASDPIPGLVTIPPATYLDFIALQDAAVLVLTDSGGVQEETTMLGVPCLTLRESTERPITVEHGSNTVVGTSTARIIEHAQSVLASGRQDYPRPALWDGRAAARISAVLQTLDDSFPRPTDLAAVFP
jgi:UDP-N-acetylglucosamine 2-epimerase (non-hydrolysing)